MSELLIELFSEEMPPNLQINARNNLKKLLREGLSSVNLSYKDLETYSTPTRLTAFVSNLPNKIKILPSEVKGPKLGVTQNIVENFARSKNMSVNDLYEKKLELLMGQIPQFYNFDEKIIFKKFDRELRKKILLNLEDTSNKFEKFLRDTLPFSLPIHVIESFEDINEQLVNDIFNKVAVNW